MSRDSDRREFDDPELAHLRERGSASGQTEDHTKALQRAPVDAFVARDLDDTDTRENIAERARLAAREERDDRIRTVARLEANAEIDEALDAQRTAFHAAAAWLALRDFVMHSDGIVEIMIVEREPGNGVDTGGEIVREITAVFADEIGEDDVDNQLANLADDLFYENAKRVDDNQRAMREARDAFAGQTETELRGGL